LIYYQEFYTHCIILVNKTWREMRATREDFKKVFDVVREQIENALATDRPKTFDQFRSQVGLSKEIDVPIVLAIVPYSKV
jgi:engulfment/cell motility protein 1